MQHPGTQQNFKKHKAFGNKGPMQSLYRFFDDQHYAVFIGKGKNGFIHTKMGDRKIPSYTWCWTASDNQGFVAFTATMIT